jgi:hypothetical protein
MERESERETPKKMKPEHVLSPPLERWKRERSAAI